MVDLRNRTKKYLFILLTALLFLTLSGTASADKATGGVTLTTVKNGTVSGGLYSDNYYGFNGSSQVKNQKNTVNHNFKPLPNNAQIKWAMLTTVVYCGNQRSNYRGHVNVTFNGKEVGYEYLNTAYTWPSEGGSGAVWLNNHLNRVTSDYLMYYDVTSLVKQNNMATITSIPYDSTFDGRIKLINLIVAYNDGDSDTIRYWVNLGHDTSTAYDDPYQGLTQFNGLTAGAVDQAKLQVVHLASNDGSYNFNGNIIPNQSPQGDYSGMNTWSVTNYYQNTGGNILTYDRTGDYYKIVLATMTVQYHPTTDLTLSNLKLPGKVYSNYSNKVNVTVSNLDDKTVGPFKLTFLDNGKAVGSQTVNSLAGLTSLLISFSWVPTTTGNHILKVILDPDELIDESNEYNNQLSVVTNVLPKLPDLKTSTITTPSKVEVNIKSQVTVSVKNIGQDKSSGGQIKLYDGNVLIGTKNLGTVNAGSTASYTFSWKPTKAGTHTLLVILDPSNLVKENNETNNQYSQIVVVKNVKLLNILLVSDGPGTIVLNTAAHEILSKYPGRLNIQVRSGSQIKAMTDSVLRSYINACDIFIGNWLNSEVSLKLNRIITANPSLAKARKVFIILETDADHVDLMKYSAIKGSFILGGISTEKLTEYRQKTRRDTNFVSVQNYLSSVSFSSSYEKFTLYKVIEDKDNAKNEILYAMSLSGFNTSYQNPHYSGTLKYGIYRYHWFKNLAEYKTTYFKTGRPVVGVFESTAYLDSEQLTVYYQIIKELEAQGINVIPVLAAGGSPDQLQVMAKYFTNAPNANAFLSNPTKYKLYVDAIVEMQAYGVGGGNFTDTTEFFTKLNVPVIRAIHSNYMTNQQWELDSKGLSATAGDRWWHIAILEAQGIIEPTFIGGLATTIDSVTGAAIGDYVPLVKNIKRMASRIKNWTRLKYLANSQKDLALIYYNYPPGKGNVGASYLDTIKSLYNLLYVLKSQGYQVNNLPATVNDLLDLIIGNKQKGIIPLGINIANWAPGEVKRMASNPNAILYPVDEYLAWFNKLDDLTKLRVKEGPTAYIGLLVKRALELKQTANITTTINNWEEETRSLVPSNRKDALNLVGKISIALKIYASTRKQIYYNLYLVYKQQFLALGIEGLSGWGEAPGSIMTVVRNGKKYFLLPGIRFGKIIIAPEPQRGWEGDYNQLYHNSVVPPHHQYLAFYAYLQTKGTDAMVHMGRHATHEWLPGKEVLLADNDFPSIVTGSVPQIYYYIMDGVAEGEQAKRRGSAVIIDHLTSPMTFTKLYGGLKQLAILADEYTDANAARKSKIIAQIKSIIKTNHLETDMGINLKTISNKALINTLDSYLADVQATLYPYGLHVIGEKWSDEKIALLVTSMLSVGFETGGGHSTTLQDQVSLVMKKKLFNSLNALDKEKVQNRCVQLVKMLIKSSTNKTAFSFTSKPSSSLILALNKAKIYIKALESSTSGEVASLLKALKGGYIAPGPGSDPVSNPNALPTGRNFYHDQAAEIPTLKAYEYGGKLALLALQKQKDTTEKIVLGIWCVETARDDGALVGMVLQLLGLKPDWSNSPSAGVNGQKLKEMPVYLKLNELIRPAGWQKKRVDVVIVTSGLFRDLYSRQAMLMDKAFRVALARSYYNIMAKASPQMKIGLKYALKCTGYYGISNEPLTSNYVAKHWVEDFQYYLSKGMKPEQAGELAICRIFAPPEGDYGAGISRAADMSWTWENRMQLADNYLRRMGHIYSSNLWGKCSPDVFRRALSGSNALYTSRNTNLYGVLDNDDFFDYWGGLSLAMERVNGKAPGMYVLSYANHANPKSVSFEQFMNRELTSRYFNPAWIKGMMSQGYSGARYMSRKFASNMWGWAVTRPGAVENWMWDEMVNVYLRDKYNLGVNQWMSSGQNSYSMISFTGTLLTAAYNGNWKTDSATLRLVATTYQKMVIANGVACCDCSCGNLAMMKWASQFMNPDLLNQFNQQIYQATGSPGFKPTTATPSSAQSSGQTQSSQESTGAASAGSSPGEEESQGQTPGDQGEGKVYEVSENESGGSSESGLPIAAIIGVLLMVGMVGFGYFRGRR